ncbi:dimethylaniline monooxygenase [N-oxide-forming] 4 isoform X2 [Ursus maritimus]|uniref:Flavin-containing monooxygenase n=1 Tax=Ursus maritimus TaxID=29073 RepID=A0A384CHN7_URSMA|nr:dimethylaniline monooxygenase [N-oxide-forming] 4 isoform X2 [Ursus maritimus]
MARRVAVIGAGVSGLSSIKCCLDEGLEPICFERSNYVSPQESSEDGMNRIYRSLVTNTCKEMSCYSDFPFQEDYPNFMNQEKFWNYLQEFAEHFDLLKYIRFRTTVCSITKRPDFSETGQWDVVTETEGKQERAVFDAVMVCTGHYLNPRLPLESFPGIHKFKGQILHSQEYRGPEGFQGKRVLVIGLGNTAGDVAVELSRTAAQVLLSTRTGAWVLCRSSDGGYPFNMVITRRCINFIAQVLPSCVLNRIQERQLNKRFNHENYGLSITKGKKSKFVVNDELPTCILCGTITMKTSVKEFTETSALFEDGTVGENIDIVIFATGYTFSFPFFEEPFKSLCTKKIFLYKRVFPSNLERATLAVIGFIGLKGSILAATELQARWATRVFKGLCQIPPSQKLMAEATKKEQLIKRPHVSKYCQRPSSNKSRIQTLPATPPATPDQATVISHQDTCWHPLLWSPCFQSDLDTAAGLSNSTLLFCSKPSDCFPFHSQKLPCSSASLQSNQLALCPHCLLSSHFTHTAPVTPASSPVHKHANHSPSEPLHLLFLLPGMFSPPDIYRLSLSNITS